MSTPTWAVHHSDGSISCFDCGRAFRTLDGVRGHRRSCPGTSGLVERVAAIGERSIPATLSGSQHAAQPLAQRLMSRWEPAIGRVVATPERPASQPLARLGLEDENARLKRRIGELEADQKELLEIVVNDLPHLAQAAEQRDQGQSSALSWIVGIGLAGVTIFWLFSSSDDDEVERKPFMGGARSSGHSLGRIVNKVGSRVVDKVLGKALGLVF